MIGSPLLPALVSLYPWQAVSPLAPTLLALLSPWGEGTWPRSTVKNEDICKPIILHPQLGLYGIAPSSTEEDPPFHLTCGEPVPAGLVHPGEDPEDGAKLTCTNTARAPCLQSSVARWMVPFILM